MDMDASMATFLPNKVLMSCSLIAFGACSKMRLVSPLIPIIDDEGLKAGGLIQVLEHGVRM